MVFCCWDAAACAAGGPGWNHPNIFTNTMQRTMRPTALQRSSPVAPSVRHPQLPPTRTRHRCGARSPVVEQLPVLAPARVEVAPPSTSSRATQEEPQPPQPPQQPQFEGFAELLLVTLLWGSYNSTLKMIYADDNPLDPATLTMLRTVLSAAALGVAVLYKQQQQGQQQGRQQRGEDLPATEDSGTQADGLPLEVPSSSGASSSSPSFFASAARDSGPPVALLSMTFTSVLAAGIELGCYNFAGTSLQAVGVKLISATRAGFLQQLIVVLTPTLSYLAGVYVSPRAWAAVALGLVGSVAVALDGLPLDALAASLTGTTSDAAASASGASSDEVQGTLCMLASCIFYSLSVVRLGMYAPKFCSVDLTAVKKATLGAASVVWFFCLVHDRYQGLSLDEQLAATGLSGRSWESWALVIYSGLAPGALATFLQTRGQSSVPAVQAQVIYSLTPIWSACAAYLLLGDEGLGPAAWAGGAAVVAAGLLAAQAHQDTASRGKQKAL